MRPRVIEEVMLPDRFHRCTDSVGANRVVRRTIDPGEARDQNAWQKALASVQ